MPVHWALKDDDDGGGYSGGDDDGAGQWSGHSGDDNDDVSFPKPLSSSSPLLSLASTSEKGPVHMEETLLLVININIINVPKIWGKIRFTLNYNMMCYS